MGMVRLVEVGLKPGKRACPPLATPAGACRLRYTPTPATPGGGAGDLHHFRGRRRKKLVHNKAKSNIEIKITSAM